MAEGFTFIVSAEEDGRLLQRVLKSRLSLSRRFLRKLKMNWGVTVNGDPVYLTSRVKIGDFVKVMLPPEGETPVMPEPIPLTIIHEDTDILVLNKQPGIVVHPTKHYLTGTIANGLIHHWHKKGQRHLVRPLNRLDKDTSGVIVFAKHAYAHDFLAKQLHTVHSVREYLAIVHGVPIHDRSTIDAPIARDPDQPSHRLIHPQGVHAVTHYTVLERFTGVACLSCRLETGRTHQIRVHMRSIGHPIIGDPMYGDLDRNQNFPMARQALHAYAIQFIHPRTRKSERYEAEIPADIQALLERCWNE